MTADEINRDDTVIIRIDRRANYKGFPIRLVSEPGLIVPKRHIIKGIFARGETSAWIAPPGGMKSALMAEAAVCIAGGMDWHGMRNKEKCGVVYFALERADLVERRIRAHMARLNIESLPIAVVGAMIDLMNPATVPRVVETIREAEACFGCSVGFVPFDTFAKLIAAGGGDENQAKDQVFANVQRIKNETDVHPALVGHTGKDEKKGARGSNAILGDVDVMVEISGDTIRTATVTKANDAPEGPLFSFKSEIHEFGTDEDGDPITVNIVSDEAVYAQVGQKPLEPRLTPNQQTMFGILHDADAVGLSTEDWNAKARELGIGTNREATLHDLATALKAKGKVREYSGVWHVAQP